MTINGINGANTQMGQMGMNQATDSYSRNIQNQIDNAQKQLQELSFNKDMTLEVKMKKRQEIQQRISDLNVQLRQHQMEQRREKQQKQSPCDEMLSGTGNSGSAKERSKSAGLSQASITAMITAGTSMKQAKAQGSVAAKAEDRAEVLKSEIKLDKARRGDAHKKQEELSDVEQRAQAATLSQLSSLTEVSKTMEEAAKEDRKMEKTDGKDISTEGKSTDGIVSGIDAQKEAAADITGESARSIEDSLTLQPTTYKSVDIRL